MKNYIRSTVKKHYKGDVGTTEENLHKWTCQVFDTDKDYKQIAYIIGDTWKEVDEKFEEMRKESIKEVK